MRDARTRKSANRIVAGTIPTSVTALVGAALIAGATLGLGGGCGDDALLFLNPSFVNRTQGGLFPLVPRPETGLLLVRLVNTTTQSISFLVTIQRGIFFADSDDSGTITFTETTELFTQPGAQTNEAGVLFDCTGGSITRVGLGRNLNQPTTDPGLIVGGFADIVQGFGVPANINPLNSEVDFFCGDTIIFQVIESTNSPGGFKVQAFVLPFELQDADTVRNTFQVAADFFNERNGG